MSNLPILPMPKVMRPALGLIATLKQSTQEAKDGKLVDLGSFAHHADDGLDATGGGL